MKFLKMLLLAAFLFATPAIITACDQNDTVGEHIEEAGDSVEEAGEEVSDEIDDATTD
tara:strand:+ start:217 stop:390 length:174 start_codon:yes stop_codon:yes gene_type:complete